MEKLINSMQDLFGTMPRLVSDQVRAFRNTIFIILVAFYGMCFAQWIGNGHWSIHLIALVLWVAAVYHDFRIQNLINTVIVGETVEAVGFTHVNDKTAKNDLIHNQLGDAVITYREKMFYFISMCVMIIPFLPIKNHPWIIAAFTVGGAVILVYILRTAGSIIRPLANTTAFVYIALNIVLMFPAVQAHINWIKGPLSAFADEDVAIAFNDNFDADRKRIKSQILRDQAMVLEWIRDNQNNSKPMPEDLAEFNVRAGRGEQVTIEKVREEIKARKETEVKTSELVNTVRPDSPGSGKDINNPMPAGNYYIDPADTKDKKTRFTLNGENHTQYRSIEDGRNFTVPPGRTVWAIKTDHPMVRIYAKEK